MQAQRKSILPTFHGPVQLSGVSLVYCKHSSEGRRGGGEEGM